jgi:osmotically-inducible protein OsmY
MSYFGNYVKITITGETSGQNIDDTTLTTAVKTILSGDKLANLTRIDVDTYNGVVSLNEVVLTRLKQCWASFHS